MLKINIQLILRSSKSRLYRERKQLLQPFTVRHTARNLTLSTLHNDNPLETPGEGVKNRS